MTNFDADNEKLEFDLTIVIVSYNTRDMLRACLCALPGAMEGLTFETWVIDNHSPDDSADMVRAEFPGVQLIANTDNPGFARANNQAIRQCRGRHVLLLNPDTEALPGSLTILVKYLDAHPGVGVVGPKLLNTDGSLQRNGRLFPTPWREFLVNSGLHRKISPAASCQHQFGRSDFDVEWNTNYVTGACLMVPRSVIDTVGMLDEDFFMFYEEVEWCWRIHRAGLAIVYLPASRVVHHCMGSVRHQQRAMTARLHKSALLYFRKTAGVGVRAVMCGVVGMSLAKNEFLYFGVAVKRRLRAHKLIR